MEDEPYRGIPSTDGRRRLLLYLEQFNELIEARRQYHERNLAAERDETAEKLEKRRVWRKRAERHVADLERRITAMDETAANAKQAIAMVRNYVATQQDPILERFIDGSVDVHGLMAYVLSKETADTGLPKAEERLVQEAEDAHTSMAFTQPDQVDAYLAERKGKHDIVSGLLGKRDSDGNLVAQRLKQVLGQGGKAAMINFRNAFPKEVFFAARGMVAEYHNTLLPWMHPMVDGRGDQLRLAPIECEIEEFMRQDYLGAPITTHERRKLAKAERKAKAKEFESVIKPRLETLLEQLYPGISQARPEDHARIAPHVGQSLDDHCYPLNKKSRDAFEEFLLRYHEERTARHGIFEKNKRVIEGYLAGNVSITIRDSHGGLERRLEIGGEAGLYLKEATFDAFRVNFMVERANKAMEMVKKMLLVVGLFKIADASGLEKAFPGAHYFAAANGDDLFQMVGDLAEAEAGTERDFSTRRRYTITGGVIGLGIAAVLSAFSVQYGTFAAYTSFGAAAGLGSLMTVMGNASYLGKQYGRLIAEGRLTREMDVRNRNGVNVCDIYHGLFGRFRAGLQDELLRPFVNGMLMGYALEIVAGATMGLAAESIPGFRHALEAFPWEGGLGGLPLAVIGMTETLYGWRTQTRALRSLQRDHADGKHYFMPT